MKNETRNKIVGYVTMGVLALIGTVAFILCAIGKKEKQITPTIKKSTTQNISVIKTHISNFIGSRQDIRFKNIFNLNEFESIFVGFKFNDYSKPKSFTIKLVKDATMVNSIASNTDKVLIKLKDDGNDDSNEKNRSFYESLVTMCEKNLCLVLNLPRKKQNC
ncbi:hypothetical protein EDEG_00294 [Edhazardia aedis USNM 41457]|uniref:Uncharacterized protein n=1 Tax=Edhazardia aedis (strain USNM 41457) TaxID=1003232 RepID=J9D3F3_EDHAE|nr:hypothetical protein EDEG_00294 [Edhazardia aedis USNM 41457]|eukprot:EJW02376.1 hypothetical protein EDEG_00294 [Edhazardia aedis USNM 41457]